MNSNINEKYFEEIRKKNILANTDTLALYDFGTSVIYFETLKTNHIDALKKASKEIKGLLSPKKITLYHYSLLKIIFPLISHEYTHFIDSTSTLWGMNHLKK